MMTLTFDPLWLYLAVALLLSLGGLAIYWFIQQNRYQQGMENLQQDLTERQQVLAQAHSLADPRKASSGTISRAISYAS